MPDIVIHRCKLRVVRRNGWAWGPDPQRLLQAAMTALPELIARRLAELWPDEIDCEMAAPLRVSIPVQLSELLAVSSGINDAAFDTRNPSTMDARLTQALTSTLERLNPALTSETTKEEPFSHDKAASGEDDIPSEVPQRGALLRLLLLWRAQGALESRLKSFTLSSLEVWHRNLMGARESLGFESETVLAESISPLVREIAAHFPDVSTDRAATLQRRLLVALEVIERLGVRPDDPRLQNELNQLLPVDGEVQTEAEEQSRAAADFYPQQPATRQEQSPAQRAMPASRKTEVYVASALPFLLAGPLSRLGYMQALAANFEAAGLLPQLPAFAAAFAYKVLDPPERGWRRSPATIAVSTAFAGLIEPVAEPALAELARRVPAHLSPLDAVLSGALIEGHDPNHPLLLQRADTANNNGLLIVDVEGLFPVAWATDLVGLLPVLNRCKDVVLLVPQEIAQSQLLSSLASAGFRFITDAPPTRDERWRLLRARHSDRWWTNDQTSPESKLLRAGRRLIDAAEEGLALWQSLGIERPAVTGTSNEALDCHLTLAASTALGSIAWTLWREREPTSPRLALERFRDLDARVHYSSESIRVRLPMGKRYQDLHEHGLLSDVRDVPWLYGRVLQFSGG